MSTQRTIPTRAFVAAFVAVSSLGRMYLAHRYYGFQTGDDLEIAEEAFRRAVGLLHIPWNVRSLLIPDFLVAPFVGVSHALGVRDAQLLAEIARYPFIVLAGLNVILVYLLGRKWYDELTGVVASGLYAAHWMPLVYGSSLYPRTVAVTCILSAALLLGDRSSAIHATIAGLLAALAVTARYSEAIFLVSLLIVIPKPRAQRSLALLGGFLVGLIVFVGFYDRLSWGGWFESLIEFANLVFVRRDAASLVVNQPPWWYISHLLHWVPLTLLPLFIVAVRRTERRCAIAFVALPVLILSAIFHKELRYLQVVIPFVLLVATRGFTLWYEQPHRRRLAVVLLLLAVPLGLARIGIAEHRSTNAAAAARWIAEQSPAAVALSQVWAYGGRLFLGNEVEITDLDIPPDLELVRRTAPKVAVLAVYSSNVDDRLRSVCSESGLSVTKTFTGRGGRAVTLFHRPETKRSS